MTPFLWERFVTDGKLNDEYHRSSGVLAALRRGSFCEPGAEPAMWPHYCQFDAVGRLTPELAAEHVCLVTYGTHQQGLRFSAHQPKRELGEALRDLRFAGSFSESAVDAHVARLATASQPDELARHLLSLVHLMKATKLQLAFDYTALFRDLVRLRDETRAGRVRRRWGAAYFRPQSESDQSPKE